jgi:N-hydroxyarylamine O-acetyltransferase
VADFVDLDAYFHRIEWRGGTDPTYATLAGLLDAHTAHIPFENLDVLLGRKIRLDLEGLQVKLVQCRRGGYCFEHAILFAAVLEALGFAPVRHAARVIVFRPPAEVPRTHMFLSVTVDGTRYVVDPGFGPFASRLPLPLDGTGVPAERPTHRVARERDDWVLYATRDGAQIPAWVSAMRAEYPIDFEVANHFTATHPDSMFRNWILASAVTPDGRVNVLNRDVTHLRAGKITKAELPDRTTLRALLVEHFGFDLPDVEALRVPAIPDWA